MPTAQRAVGEWEAWRTHRQIVVEGTNGHDGFRCIHWIDPITEPIHRVSDRTTLHHALLSPWRAVGSAGTCAYGIDGRDGSVEDGSPVLTAPTSRCRGARLRGQPRKHVGQASRLERARQRLDESPVLLLDVPGVALALPTHDFCEGTHDGTGQNEGER